MDAELVKLQKRAESAQSGYTADVNITCYVYAKDVLYLLGVVKQLQSKMLGVAEELRLCVTDNGDEGGVSYGALGAVSVERCCKLLEAEVGLKG